MIKKPFSTRREVIQATGGLVGGAALGGCAPEEEEPAPVTKSEDQDILECVSGSRRRHSLKARGAFGNIEHVVVLMMENRSFDHAFGALSIPRGLTDEFGRDLGGEGRTGVNGLTGNEFNLDLAGNEVRIHRLEQSALGDITHEWEDCRRQFDWANTGVGKNDGFVRQHEVDVQKGDQGYCATYKYFGSNIGCAPVAAPMGIYARSNLPVSYALADAYTLCDNWYSSVLGPTWPNRFYLHLGTSNGVKGGKPVLTKKSVWDVMKECCVAATNYYCDIPWGIAAGEIGLTGKLGDGKSGGVLQQFHASQIGIGSFYQDVENDELPNFCIIDPGFSSGYDDHPPADTMIGQAFISYVYRILASNPDVWAKTLLIITYDEHGSFYDHVVPPGNVAGSPQSFDENAEFRQLGIRVPSLVIGPHAKKGYVSHNQYDHCSVLSSVYDRFDLTKNGAKHLTERARRTNTLADCIDQNIDPDDAPPPADVPVLEFSENEMMEWAAGVHPDGQPGLSRMVERGEVPQELDLRPYRQKNMAEFLEIGEKVGAFKIRR